MDIELSVSRGVRISHLLTQQQQRRDLNPRARTHAQKKAAKKSSGESPHSGRVSATSPCARLPPPPRAHINARDAPPPVSLSRPFSRSTHPRALSVFREHPHDFASPLHASPPLLVFCPRPEKNMFLRFFCVWGAILTFSTRSHHTFCFLRVFYFRAPPHVLAASAVVCAIQQRAAPPRSSPSFSPHHWPFLGGACFCLCCVAVLWGGYSSPPSARTPQRGTLWRRPDLNQPLKKKKTTTKKRSRRKPYFDPPSSPL